MGQSKQTKKFEKRHLTDTLKRRKDFAKVKQRHQQKEKRKAKHVEDEDDNDAGQGHRAKKQKSEGSRFEDMTVDDFFAGDFDIAKQKSKPPRSSKKSKKKKSEATRDGSDDDSAASDTNAFGEEEDDLDLDEDADAAAGLHANDLKELATKDPEFYQFLKDNDADLLDFADTSDLRGDVDSDEDKADRGVNGLKKSQKKRKGVDVEDTNEGDLSKSTISKWTTSMSEQHSLRAMRELVLAFRAAAHVNEEEVKQHKYTISNADVYHEVVVSALKLVPVVLSHHLPIKELQNGKIRMSTDSRKFRVLAPLLKSHTIALQHLLGSLSDSTNIRLTLKSILDLSPYFLSFKKVVRDMIRLIVEIWADHAQSEAIRISAFLVLRRLSVIGDHGIKEHVLRTVYQGLIKGSRSTTMYNLAGINLMKNSALELWGLVDSQIAYTTSFTFIRQLAIHLRNSIKNNSNESYKTVYNWQYEHSLDFWSRVLATHCESLREASQGGSSPLRPLIYPLTQVTLGAMRLIPTSAYFPLRFHLIRALIRLSASTNTFIPLASALYEVLQSAEMRKPPRPATVKPLDFETNIRAAKGLLRTRVYQDGVGEQIAELLTDYFALWCKNIAFPELALPTIVMVRRWVKEVSTHDARRGKGPRAKLTGLDGNDAKGNRNAKMNNSITLVVQKLEANSRYIEEKRAQVDFAPNNRAGVEDFLKEVEARQTPLGAFAEGQRKQRAERRRLIEQGREAEQQKRKKDKEANGRANGDFDEQSDRVSDSKSDDAEGMSVGEDNEDEEDEDEDEDEFEDAVAELEDEEELEDDE